MKKPWWISTWWLCLGARSYWCLAVEIVTAIRNVWPRNRRLIEVYHWTWRGHHEAQERIAALWARTDGFEHDECIQDVWDAFEGVEPTVVTAEPTTWKPITQTWTTGGVYQITRTWPPSPENPVKPGGVS